MKVFLSADMEGTCGIVSWPETERTTPFDYSPAQKQMTREVAAACQGAPRWLIKLMLFFLTHNV